MREGVEIEKILWQWFFSLEEGRVWGKIEKMWKRRRRGGKDEEKVERRGRGRSL